MIFAWGGILLLTGWCLYRVLGGPSGEKFDNPEPPVPPTA